MTLYWKTGDDERFQYL